MVDNTDLAQAVKRIVSKIKIRGVNFFYDSYSSIEGDYAVFLGRKDGALELARIVVYYRNYRMLVDDAYLGSILEYEKEIEGLSL